MFFGSTENVIKKYYGVRSKKNQSIGAILKHHRLLRGETLEQVSKNICSTSYLSKVENNVIIPSKKYLNKLYKRLYINEEKINYKSDTSWIIDILINNKINVRFDNESSYQYKLLKFIKSVINDEKTLYDNYIEAFKYINNYQELEFHAFLYYFSLAMYKKERYYDSLQSTKELLKISYDQHLRANIYKLKFFNMIKLNRRANYKVIYKKTEEILFELARIEDILSIYREKKYYEAKFFTKKEIESDFDYVKILNKDDIKQIKFNYYFYNKKDYNKSIEFIKDIYDKNACLHLNYIINLYKIQEKETTLKEIDNMKSRKLPQSYEIIIEYIYNKFNNKDTIDYIRNNIINNKNFTTSVDLLYFIYDEAIKDFKNRHLYKEMTILMEQKQNKIKKLAEIAI